VKFDPPQTGDDEVQSPLLDAQPLAELHQVVARRTGFYNTEAPGCNILYGVDQPIS
jgi:hypothetical protein